MINNISDKKIKFIVNYIYISLIAFIAYISLKYGFKILFPFIFSFIIATIAEPFVSALTKKLKISRSICSLFCIVVIFLIICSFFVFISAYLINCVVKNTEVIPSIVEKIKESFLRFTEDDNGIASKISSYLIDYISGTDITKIITGSVGSEIIKPFSEFIKTLPSMMLSTIVTIISSVLISASYPQIKKFILLQFSINKRTTIYEFKTMLTKLIKNYLKSYTIIMLITFSELTILFFIFKIKPVFTLSLVISLIDILPVLGTGVILLPWSAYLFLTGSYVKGSVIVSIYLLITVVRQIIEPKIVGKSIGLHPLLTLASIFIGFKLFGIIGIILMPITLMILIELNNNNVIKFWRKLNIDKNEKQQYNVNETE